MQNAVWSVRIHPGGRGHQPGHAPQKGPCPIGRDHEPRPGRHFSVRFAGTAGLCPGGGSGGHCPLGSLPLCLLAACCTGWLVGPALTGLYDTILRALRDEPGFWWHTYKRVWKQSFKSSFLPGMIFTVLWALVGYAAFALPLMADVSTSFVWILLLDAVLLLTGLWVPNLLAMMAVYAPVEKSLHLEAKIHDVQNR